MARAGSGGITALSHPMGEFDLIARIAGRVDRRGDVLLGIGDDAAVLAPAPGHELVACCDTLNVGVHFLPDTPAADIGWKALAVNLSDLAAMGATPAWALLSLSLPQADKAFVDGFLDGFQQLSRSAGVALVGGDTTSGPLSICVTVLGQVPAGQAIRRSGARVGDLVCVSGTLGDAAGGLQLQTAADPPQGADTNWLVDRMRRPQPRLQLGRAMRGRAHAAADVSDGLLADLSHIAVASGVGMRIKASALPCSKALRAVFDDRARLALQATGGDDYELIFTVPADCLEDLRRAADAEVSLSCIGEVVETPEVVLLNDDGQSVCFDRLGWNHFADGGGE